MKKILFALSIIVLSSFSSENYTAKLLTEKDTGYLLKELNTARNNPSAYGKKLGIDLSSFPSRQKLKVDPYLVKIAEAKALEMAKSGILSHYSPGGNLNLNNVSYQNAAESCSMTYFSYSHDGNKDHIKNLIEDTTIENGHRRQLLGHGIHHSHNVIGIAVATNEKLESYCCVITALK